MSEEDGKKWKIPKSLLIISDDILRNRSETKSQVKRFVTIQTAGESAVGKRNNSTHTHTQSNANRREKLNIHLQN